MRMISARPAILFFLAITLFLCLPSRVDACSCMGPGPVCQDYWGASVVFVGTVIDSKLVPIKIGGFDHQERLVRLSIDEGFRGVEGAQVEVATGLGGGDCGFGFRQAQQYLVYAYEFEGRLTTGICTRTKDISAAAVDLKYMRGLRNGSAGGSIYGEVVAHLRNETGGSDKQAIPAATVTFSGVTTKEIKTNAKGEYRVDALPPGDYTVKVNLPNGMTIRESEHKVTVSPGGCALVSFWLDNDGQINGRVLNPQGLPVNKAEITLMEFDKPRYRGYVDYSYSDEEGNYGFKRLPFGKYVLAIRFDGLTSQNRPFPEIFYPVVSDRSQAKIFSIGKGQAISDFNLEMPPLPLEFEVAGNVVWSDGKPAVGARVSYMVVNDAISYAANKNGESNFSFKAYEGLKLALNASFEPADGKNVYSEWVNVTVAPGAPSIRLVLPRP